MAPAVAAPPSLTEVRYSLYDLTPAEAWVFARIAAGMTRSEAASALGSEPSTVKAHLAQIFAKTGTRRQSELAALAAAITAPIRP
jgi:DNA-binding CsgD family transcriptional regulator